MPNLPAHRPVPVMSTSNPLPVRSPLDMLRLDYPGHAITQRAIWGKQFYIAAARQPRVQPVYAQAATIDRLREKLQRVVLHEINTSRPSIPRVYDFLLGGKDNFAADRIQAETLLDIYPRSAELARESRNFQQRAITYTAQAGITGFIDLGCGLPTAPSTHETARAVQPAAQVAYIDNDAMVLSHARSLLAGDGGVTVLDGDLACPEEIFCDWRLRQAIDLTRPMCVVLTAMLHFFDADAAQRIVAEITDAIAPGSYLIVSVVQADGDLAERGTAGYQPARLHHHGPDALAGFLAGLDLIAPGITQGRAWRAPSFIPNETGAHIWAAVAQKAGTTL
jgi:SAM-dependent methyltransferase